MSKKRPLIVLTGPTAVGKSHLAISLAKAVDGEIVSADSMQVYEYMDIGSAKIKKEEMEGVPHHLIDVLKPWDSFNVVTFQSLCKQALEEIYARGKVPILVGGTGFYIQSVLYDVDFAPPTTEISYRESLELIARQFGAPYLHDMLKKVDARAAAEIHPNNTRRVVRALEFQMQTGFSISEHNEAERRKESAFASCYFVLNEEREKLYERIDKRVDKMLADGLLEEVKRLRDMGCKSNMVSMQGLGYKQLLDYLNGKVDLGEAIYCIKRDTRHFAKRQLTWFKREKEVIWMDKETFDYDESKMLEFMLEQFNTVMERND